jgi:hypothetical protein
VTKVPLSLSDPKKILASVMDRSPIGTMVGDIKRLASGFSMCLFKHVSRPINVAEAYLSPVHVSPLAESFFGDVILDCIRDPSCTNVMWPIKLCNSHTPPYNTK